MPSWPDAVLARAADHVIDALAPERASDRAALVRYVQALARFGAHTDLVGARTPEALAEIALADALVLARHAEWLGAPVWEIGAGGASLLVPLALMIATLHGTAFEPRQKRATFLRMAVGTLDLVGRIAVEQKRIEPAHIPAGAASTALSRAVFAPEVWVPMALALVAPRGTAVVLTTAPIDAPTSSRVLAVDTYALPSGASRIATWLRAAEPEA